MNKIKEAREGLKKIVKRWQGQIDFQKENPKHYKLFKQIIDNQQKEVDALQTALNLMNEYLKLDEKLFPKKEKINKLCACDTPDEYMDKTKNLIICENCKLQVGYKTWNACLHELKFRYLKNGLSEGEIETIMQDYMRKNQCCIDWGYVEEIAQQLFNAYQEKGRK